MININEAIKVAFEHYLTGNLEQAESICLQILQVQPNNLNILNLLGLIYYKLERCNLAVKYLKKALEQNPMNVNVHYNLGNVYKDKEQLDDAITHYQKALEINPNLYESLNNLGTVLQDKGQLDDAVACYEKALQLNPHLVDAYYNLGTVLQDKKNLDDAKKNYQKAIQLDPNFDAAYISLRDVSQREGQRFAARQSLFCEQWTLGAFTFQVDNHKKLLYVEIAKNGSTAIKYELFWKPLFGNNTLPADIAKERNPILGYHFAKTLVPYKDFFKFTVIRDPYTRFMSAYFHLIHKQYRTAHNYNFLKNLGIADWPDEIVNDPNIFLHKVDKEILNRDRHTALQSYLLPENLDELDYIGQIENMEDVGKKLSQILHDEVRFNLPHLKGPVTDYYSIKIDVKRFNQLFREDYETLNKFYKPLDSSLFPHS